jgi:hypothetical protein
MGSEGLERVLGKAVLDKAFFKELKKDPAEAAKTIGASLTAEEIDGLIDLSKYLRNIDSFDQVTMDQLPGVTEAVHSHSHHDHKPLLD